MKLRDDFDNILDAFDTMEHYLRVISPLASHEMHESLRVDSVKLLAQVIKFLGVVTRVQQDGRMSMFSVLEITMASTPDNPQSNSSKNSPRRRRSRMPSTSSQSLLYGLTST